MSALRRMAAACLVALLMHAGASAQTMRFETSVGSFDMELNPTNDPNLQPLVDNMVAYIGLGRYHYTAINRAAEDFVLQMGSFLGFPPTPNDFLGLVQEILRLKPVTVDANNDGQVDFASLSNTRGTVSLALSSAGPNSGTSSFFINLGDNSGLDSQGFVPFARIANMATIDRIMALDQTNLSGDPNDLTFKDTPLLENGRLVILKSVHVLQAAPNFSFTGPISAAIQQSENAAAQAAQLAADLAAAGAADVAADAALTTEAIIPLTGAAVGAIPEPASAMLVAVAAGFIGAARRRMRASR